jgi:hypothetical protein
MGVSQTAHRHPGHKIEVVLSVHIGEPTAASFSDDQLRKERHFLKARRYISLFFLADL